MRHLLVTFACLFVLSGVASSQCVNKIVCENAQTGDANWDPSVDDTTIQGFTTDTSYNLGQTVTFKVKTNANQYRLNIYRMGWYRGAGARKVDSILPSAALPQIQPPCVQDSNTGLADCGNWAPSASWTIPTSAVSGLYFANLVREDTGGFSQVFFVVRDDSSTSDILYQTSDQTWQAYNPYGGHSLYGGANTFDLSNRGYKVSYNRPVVTRSFSATSFLYNGEYPMIRWLEANGYDVSYFSNVDAARSGALIKNHKLYLSTGHDEYVDAQRRASTEAARDAGVNLAFFSGNEFFWKTRWENSIDGNNTPYRTMVCYKETYYGSGNKYQKDPASPPTWTGTWRDPRFSPPADGGRPENALTGTLFLVNGPGSDNTNLTIQVPAEDGKMRFWRNTSVANLNPGESATLASGSLGYEWDVDADNGYRPAGLVPLSTSTYSLTTDYLLDYGSTYGAGTATHRLSMYRASSGALVFGAGSVQWSWGLDNYHDSSYNGTTADVRMQQATVNLFADMGVQSMTLQSGLVTATKSTDTTAPTSVITAPTAGSSVPYGVQSTITGTATDTGGGVVGAVEVSTDGGQSWHPAKGREQWSYRWKPSALSGTVSIQARAVDDSANLQSAPTTLTVSISGGPTCPCSIWTPSSAPSTPSANDSSAVELGLKFQSDVSGYISGVRFYKGSLNTGTHIGNLWAADGTKLGSVTFIGETASGWQLANFSSPIPIAANTTYVVSYFAPNGGYAADSSAFATAGVDTPPLHALSSSTAGGNGVYIYGSGGGFPMNNYASTNYWVDVVYTTGASSTYSLSGTVTGGGSALLTLSGSSSATTTADGSGNYSFANLANGSYTVTPSKSGYSISPTNRTVTVSGANTTGVNFTATALPTYSISGTISPAASSSGATVTLNGGSTQTTTVNGSGGYTFTGLINGNYTVAPSKPGFTFSPASAAVTVNGASLSGVDFSAAAIPTYSISGTVTNGGGAAVVLSGGGSGTTTADTAGNYAFANLVANNYTVTPSKTGFAMSPAQRAVAVGSASVTGVNFTASQATSIWSSTATPATASANDTAALEIGLRFQSDVAGTITGIRFYKGAANTGTHVGHLWTNTGTLLGTVTFTGETTSGWQQANFATPIAISAGTTYIVSYYAPKGAYSVTSSAFSSAGVNNVPLHALSNAAAGGNGVYLYQSGGGFPTNSYNATNYWVDVVFNPGT